MVHHTWVKSVNNKFVLQPRTVLKRKFLKNVDEWVFLESSARAHAVSIKNYTMSL